VVTVIQDFRPGTGAELKQMGSKARFDDWWRCNGRGGIADRSPHQLNTKHVMASGDRPHLEVVLEPLTPSAEDASCNLVLINSFRCTFGSQTARSQPSAGAGDGRDSSLWE
jgi:hypothetical protein